MKKVTYGSPIPCFAIEKDVEEAKELVGFTVEDTADGYLKFTMAVSEKTAIYGLGETVGNINKKGSKFISFNTDDPHHRENTLSLYGSHNLLIFDELNITPKLGFFFDTPGKVIFDLDSEHKGKVKVTVCSKDLRVYFWQQDTAYAAVKEFLSYICRSFIPHLWAFGLSQSRWGYKDEKDIRNIIDEYEKADLPLDSVCMDIDYMDKYTDFTVNKKRFPNLKRFNTECNERGVHLVPIIDAGVKILPKNPFFKKGIERDLFCKNIEGKPFMAAVWPCPTHFPDFFKEEARDWFGKEYKMLTDMGITGFWKDMNEPAVFYSEMDKSKGILETIMGFLNPHTKEKKAMEETRAYKSYRHFYHEIGEQSYVNQDVHNEYGSRMTQAGHDGLTELTDKRFLLYSRASMIGGHRYGGIWTGDNESRWDHLFMNVRQMPCLNMCGFLYSGADTGGFGGNTTEELLLRWTAFSIFTPLFRNHTAIATKNQEYFRFENRSAFKNLIGLRYRLIPYLYSEFMISALSHDMFIKPLSFSFPYDEKARGIEDQLIVGGSLMIAPVIKEGATGRNVYIPKDMELIRYKSGTFTKEKVEKGMIYIEVPPDEVVFFLLPEKSFIYAKKECRNTMNLDLSDVEIIGDSDYKQYMDDGLTRKYSLSECVRIVKRCQN